MSTIADAPFPAKQSVGDCSPIEEGSHSTVVRYYPHVREMSRPCIGCISVGWRWQGIQSGYIIWAFHFFKDRRWEEREERRKEVET
jgi:hypothetical protein